MALTSDALDAWLPDPEVRTHHRRRTHADPDVLWAAARSVRLDQTGTIGRLVRWRIPGVAGDQSFAGLLAEDPFYVLEEGEHYSISGLCGRIWTLSRDYADLLEGADAFRTWDEPRAVRVLFAHWIEPDDDGANALVSEARVQPTDRAGAMYLRAVWLALGPFERLIGAEPIAIAVARAEQQAAA